jgi:hypothetical protein
MSFNHITGSMILEKPDLAAGAVLDFWKQACLA